MIFLLLFYVVFFTPALLLCLAWIRVFRSKPNPSDPKWRRAILFAALAAATINALSFHAMILFETPQGRIKNDQIYFDLELPVTFLLFVFCLVGTGMGKGPSKKLIQVAAVLTMFFWTLLGFGRGM